MTNSIIDKFDVDFDVMICDELAVFRWRAGYCNYLVPVFEKSPRFPLCEEDPSFVRFYASAWNIDTDSHVNRFFPESTIIIITKLKVEFYIKVKQAFWSGEFLPRVRLLEHAKKFVSCVDGEGNTSPTASLSFSRFPQQLSFLNTDHQWSSTLF